MNCRVKLAMGIIALSALGGVLSTSKLVAQPNTLKEQIVGMWLVTSAETTMPDGTKAPSYGPSPRGGWALDSSGHYLAVFINPSIPRFASNNRLTGTPDENKALVQGVLGGTGTYTIDEATKSLVFHVQASTFPNRNGLDQKFQVTAVSANELNVIASPPGGREQTPGSTTFKLERAK